MGYFEGGGQDDFVVSGLGSTVGGSSFLRRCVCHGLVTRIPWRPPLLPMRNIARRFPGARGSLALCDRVLNGEIGVIAPAMRVAGNSGVKLAT
jgi:hypothetical protein